MKDTALPARPAPAQRAWLPLLAAAATLATVQTTSAALLAYEGFDYTPDQTFLGQNGGFGFAQSWQTNTTALNNATVANGGFGYTDLFGNSLVVAGNRAHVTGNGTVTGDNTGGNTANAQPQRHLSFVRGSNGVSESTWVSLIAQRTGQAFTPVAPTNYFFGRAAGLQFHVAGTPTAGSSEMFTVGRASQNTETNGPGGVGGLPDDTWALYNRGSANFTMASTTGLTNLVFILMRIDHVGAANPVTAPDTIRFWLNHENLGLEPLDVDADAVISANSFAGNADRDYVFNRLRLFGGSLNNVVGYGAMDFDEIRIGETFGDVTPFVPEPAALGLFGLGGMLLLARRARRS